MNPGQNPTNMGKLRSPNQIAAQKRVMLIAGVMIAVMIGVQAAPLLFKRQTITLTITGNYSPRECRKQGNVFGGPKHRSSIPRVAGLYCGVITSDHGSFALPQSNRLNIFFPTREQLFDTLSVGCTYKVVVAGYGLRLEQGRNGITNRNRELLSASLVGACPVANSATVSGVL